MKRKRKPEMDAAKKKTILEIVSLGLGVLLSILAVKLMEVSFYTKDEWTQSLFLSLGTGAAMSALVSWVFYINDKIVKKRNRLNARIAFMNDFKILYFRIINNIDFAKETKGTVDLETYVKKQHRWYHEYYKRIVAESDTKEETAIRRMQLQLFVNSVKTKLYECFEYNPNWRNGAYSEWQHKEIMYVFTAFKNIEIYMDTQDDRSAFLAFAFFLECIKRMSKEFVELNTFRRLSFTYDSEGKRKANTEEFEAKEPMFKFAREFNEIRNKNYKKYYAEVSKQENTMPSTDA